MSFTLPPLPYAYEALEPHIDTEPMKINHDKHNQAYVENMKKAMTGTPNEKKKKECDKTKQNKNTKGDKWLCPQSQGATRSI